MFLGIEVDFKLGLKKHLTKHKQYNLGELYKTNKVGGRLLLYDYNKDKKEVDLLNPLASNPLKLVNEWMWGYSPSQ